MKTIYQLLALSLISIFVFSACGDEKIIKNTDKDKYTLTYKIDYKGVSEVKQVRAALFDYETSVKNQMPTGAPASALSFPTEALSTGRVDFTKEVEIKLEGFKGKKYLVVIYGDVDTTDGKLSVNQIDPVFTLKNFKPTEDKTFDIELKDQASNQELCSKEHPNGTCEEGKTCNNGVCEGETTCEPDCSNGKICGDDGCGNVCGTCEEGKVCSSDQLTCEATTKTYKIKLKVNYNGSKTIKRIGIAGYYEDGYSGMPNYVQFVDDNNDMSFPYTFTFDPTKDGKLGNIPSDYQGDFYIWLYGDTDGSGFQATDSDPQVKFKLVLPKNDTLETIEILDID